MNKLSIVLVFSLILMSAKAWSQTQQDCIVLLPALKGDYNGGCRKGLAHGPGIAKGNDIYKGDFKKGLPHGEGVYNWSNGDIYEGDWRKGERDGFGEMKTKIDGRDTILSGYWEDDEFIGKRKNQRAYRIVNQRNIDRVNIRKRTDKATTTVYIKVVRGGQEIQTQSFMMVGNSGSQFDYGLQRGFDNVNLPFNCKVDFQAYSKSGSQLILYQLAFEIFENGIWDVMVWI